MTDGDSDSGSQPRGVLPSKYRHDSADPEDVDPEAVLEQLQVLELCRWQDPAEDTDGVEHLGPAAEEFYEVFGLGVDSDRIAAGDTDGVAMAAIQGLADRLDARDVRLKQHDSQIQEQQAMIDEQRADLELLRERLESLQTEVARLRLDVADRD